MKEWGILIYNKDGKPVAVFLDKMNEEEAKSLSKIKNEKFGYQQAIETNKKLVWRLF